MYCVCLPVFELMPHTPHTYIRKNKEKKTRDGKRLFFYVNLYKNHIICYFKSQ